MFEHYTLADLMANLYKKRVVNSIIFVLLTICFSMPIVLQALNSKVVIKGASNFSSYIIYKIDKPTTSLTTQETADTGYSDFYKKLLQANLNGAYLFNEISDDQLQEIAEQLDTNTTLLRNSTEDFWDKKLTIYALDNDKGVSVKILTASKALNTVLETKFDTMMNSYAHVYAPVSIQKVNTVYSETLERREEVKSGFAMKSVVLKVVMMMVVAAFVVIFISVLRYLFNPTINHTQGFGLETVFYLEDINQFATVLAHKYAEIEQLTFVSSQEQLLKRVQATLSEVSTLQIAYVLSEDTEALASHDHFIFIEELGQTRYHVFSRNVHTLRLLNKTILGVATYKL